MKNRFYKLFTHADPSIIDFEIDKFLAEGRKEIRIDRTMNAREVQEQLAGMKIPGLKLPPGAVQITVQLSFYAILVYEGNAKDLEAQQKSKLSIES